MTQPHSSALPGRAVARHRGRSSLPWRWLILSAASGVPVGLLWSVLAPGGLNLLTRDPALASGLDPAAWLPRDLTLAGLFVFAGCLSGVLLADRIMHFSHVKFAFALAGGLLGAVVAWGAGMLAASWWAGPVDASADGSIAFSLRSLPVLLIWPAATAAATFVTSLLSRSATTGSQERQLHGG